MKKILSGVCCCALLTTSYAQQNLCGSMDMLRRHLAGNSEAAEQYLKYIELSKQDEIDFAQNGSSSRALSDTVYIPVVFHIIHNGDAIGASNGENISDEQVISQIEALNENFSLTNENAASIPEEFRALAARTKIRFCLAKFDPDGNRTTGILRHNLGEATWDQDGIENQVKPATIWNRDKYLNVWTVRPGGDLASGILAYAQFPPPFGGSANTDGIVSRYNVIGTKGILMSGYNKGKTLVHEIGHWLGLFHIWGDDDGSCNGSDNVSDTPNQGDQYFGCPSHPQESCGSKDMFMNHMDYTNDECRSMFTLGQEARMMGVLNGTLSGFRRTTLKTGGLSSCYYNIDATIAEVLQPDSTLCTNMLNPIIYVKNIGQTDISSVGITYGIDGNLNTFTWTGSLPALTNTHILLPEITGINNGNHEFKVFITTVNGLQDNDLQNDSASVSFSVDYQGEGFYTPYTEDFESGFYPPADWTILNPSNDAVKWLYNENIGGYGQSYYSIWIDNSAYTSTPGKRKDAFVMQNLDFSQINKPRLSFQYAYTARGTRYDSLEISYSLNCGTTWNAFWKSGGKAMSTSDNEAERPFVPLANEWDSAGISLAHLSNQKNVLIKFENITAWGNALYIDNINVYGEYASGISTADAEKVNVSIFPNPASKSVTVKLPENHPFSEIKINDALGRRVDNRKIIDPITFLNVSDLTEGVYFITLYSNTFKQTEKLIIAK